MASGYLDPLDHIPHQHVFSELLRGWAFYFLVHRNYDSENIVQSPRLKS